MSTTLSGDDTYKLLIGGEWVAGGDGAYAIVNPATEEVVAEAPEASADQARAAAARRAGGVPGVVADRSRRSAPRLLQAAADAVKARAKEFVPLVIAETGCTYNVGQHDAGPDGVDPARALRRRRAGVRRDPARAAGDAGDRAGAGRSHRRARPTRARRRGRVHHARTTSRS